jgi:hypothetical protein
MAKFVCPFCINRYNIKEVQYVCPNCNTASKPASFEKEPVKCKNVYSNGNKCGGLAIVRKCPKCGNEIPKTALETPTLPFSIVGVAASGKTNYITVMLHELGRASGLKLALSAQNKETNEHQNENYKYIYEDHQPPEATSSGEPPPQIWCIKNRAKQKGNIVPTYTFTIFDGAGEDIENLDASSTVCRYINTSKAIILVLDPLILENIRKGDMVDEDVKRNSLAGMQSDYKKAVEVVDNVVNYIKLARGIGANKKLDIPVAVVLSKFDIILNHKSFAEDALVKNHSLNVTGGQINMTEIKQVHEEIEAWLEEIGEVSFIEALKTNFKEFYFFGVSSYGAPPKEGGMLNEIKPHRVLDPILWLFKRERFVD